MRSSYLYCPYDGTRLANKARPPGGGACCPVCGFEDYQNPKACVAILIMREGTLLLARRGIEPALGAWDIPGGFVDHGESAEEAVVREALEETTLRVKPTRCLCTVPDIYGDRETPTLNLCYLAEIISGTPEAKSDVAELVWFPLNKLPRKMAFPHQTRVLSLLRKIYPSVS